jgi:hypothetical protein
LDHSIFLLSMLFCCSIFTKCFLLSTDFSLLFLTICLAILMFLFHLFSSFIFCSHNPNPISIIVNRHLWQAGRQLNNKKKLFRRKIFPVACLSCYTYLTCCKKFYKLSSHNHIMKHVMKTLDFVITLLRHTFKPENLIVHFLIHFMIS